jgi:CysZ protein
MDAVRGILLVARTPRLWPLCSGPLFAAVAAYVLLGVLGGVLVVPRLTVWLGAQTPAWAVATGAAALVIWVALFPFLFVLLAGIFSGLIFDRLSDAVERIAGAPGAGAPAAPGMPRGAVLRDSLARLLLNGALGAGALVFSFALGPIPGVLAAAVIGLLDFTSPAYLRRGHTLRAQTARLLGRPDAATVSFAFAAGLLSLIPLLGVFLLPGLVAGGTLLVRRREGTQEKRTRPAAGPT